MFVLLLVFGDDCAEEGGENVWLDDFERFSLVNFGDVDEEELRRL